VPAGAIAPAVLADAARAASVVGLRLAGVDLITPDAGRPLAETGGAVIEVNADPGLHHHYQVADPETATPVAVRMLERLLQP
jgi:cyanophycin synthetase